MLVAIRLRDDFNADDVRMAAARCKDADQYRRLLAIAAIYDGRRFATMSTGPTPKVRMV